jgi:hypothetical protein
MQISTDLSDILFGTPRLVHTYAKGAKPPSGVQFSAEALPKTQLVEAKTLAGLQAIAEAFEKEAKAQDAKGCLY